MTKYVLKRIFLAIVTIWVVATLTFFLMNLVPGGPFYQKRRSALRLRQRSKPNMVLISRSGSSI